MTTFTATLPANVTATLNKQPTDIDTSAFHEDAIAAIWEYGVRRWVQDNVNSLAAQHRNDEDAEGEFDYATAVADRIKQAVEGDLNRRSGGAGASSETVWARKAVRELAKVHTKLAARIKATEAGDERNALLDKVASENSEVVAEVVERLKREAAERASAAKAASAELSL